MDLWRMKKLFLSMAALSLPSWAHAQAVVDRAAAFLGETEPIPEPEFRVVGFQDRPGVGNCDPYYASLGLCIEVVDFIPVEDLWRDSAQFSSTAVIQRDRNAQLRSMGKAYSVVLDSLALEWFRDDGPIATSLREDGYDNLPGAPDLCVVLLTGVFPAGSRSMVDRGSLDASRWRSDQSGTSRGVQGSPLCGRPRIAIASTHGGGGGSVCEAFGCR